MTWWCSATGLPWTWEWRAYPGIWIVVVLFAVILARSLGRDARGPSRRAVLYGATAVIALWIGLDWPLGTLGSGYLLSVHTVQYVLLTFGAAPLALHAVSLGAKPRGRVARFLAHPLVGLAGFNLILALTHVPSFVDALMPNQWGSFLVEMGWLVGGLMLWWPVQAPAPTSRLSDPLKMGYLFLSTIPPTIPSAILVFADLPLYRLYELAPRVNGISAKADQQVAGLIMKLVADPIVWLAIGLVFFRWQREERRDEGSPPPTPHSSALIPS